MNLPAANDQDPQIIPAAAGLDALFMAWFAAVDMAETTRTTYQTAVRKYRAWLDDNPEADPQAPTTIRQWRDFLTDTYSHKTASVWLSGVKSFYSWAYEAGMIPSNPAHAIRGPRGRGSSRHKRDALTPAEVLRVLDQAGGPRPIDKRNRAIVALMAYAALRTVEIHRADCEHLQTRAGRLILWVQGKGHAAADDYIVLNDQAEAALRDWIAVHPRPTAGPLFILFNAGGGKPTGDRITRRRIRYLVKGLYRRAGVVGERKTTHSLRHSAISQAIRNGARLEHVQAMARHTNVSTTMIYFHESERLTNPAEDMISYDQKPGEGGSIS